MRKLVCILALAIGGCSASSAISPTDAGGGDAGVVDAGQLVDAGSSDAGNPDAGQPTDGGGSDGGCYLTYDGVWGSCISTTDCAALGDHTSTAGYCPGPSDIQCCTDTPDVADNPPVPAGWQLMAQADVTTDMTNWAVSILHDGLDYPMYSTTTQWFGAQDVMARVEWHPPDFQNSAVHRGVTLYEPIPDGG